MENVYALLGGTQAWKSAGYPMEGTRGRAATTTQPAAATAQPAANKPQTSGSPAPEPVRTNPQMDTNGPWINAEGPQESLHKQNYLIRSS